MIFQVGRPIIRRNLAQTHWLLQQTSPNIISRNVQQFLPATASIFALELASSKQISFKTFGRRNKLEMQATMCYLERIV